MPGSRGYVITVYRCLFTRPCDHSGRKTRLGIRATDRELTMKVSVVSKRRSLIGEGPHWDGHGGLWHVDINAGEVCKLDPRTHETETRNIGGYATLVIPYSSQPSNKLLVGHNRQLQLLDWDSPAQGTVLTEAKEVNTRFNDGKCDASGRLWAGTMGIETGPAILEPGQGSLYSMGKDLQLHHHLSNISISNGLAWSRNNKNMFYIDSLDRNVKAFDFNLQNGTIDNCRILHQLDEADGYPDGMCIDCDECIWVACFDGSKVICIDTNTGIRTRTVTLPTAQITSCCFGGDDYQDLYVTSANNKVGLSEEAGAVFKITGLGVKGLPLNNFSG